MSEALFIGTSDAFGAGGRRQSAILMRAPQGAVLLDCGATTATGLNALGVDRNEIDAIVVSHFHGDHFGGIPHLLLGALYEDRRKHALHIAGPEGIEERVRQLARAMGHSMEDREFGFPVIFEEVPPGSDVEVGPVRVSSFETRHQPDVNPHGMILHAGKRRVAYSGDTGWFEELPQRVAGVDLFICECTYHSFEYEYHLNHTGLVERRNLFDCGRMVITHLGSEMAERRGELDLETADDGLSVRF